MGQAVGADAELALSSELFDLRAELVLKLFDAHLSDAQFSLLLRQLLMWC